jgi:hypothetical protein
MTFATFSKFSISLSLEFELVLNLLGCSLTLTVFCCIEFESINCLDANIQCPNLCFVVSLL